MSNSTCSVEDCQNTRKIVSGLCYSHYRQARRRGDYGLCSVESCERGRDRGDMCNTHYVRKLRGHPMETPIKFLHNDGLGEDIKHGRAEKALVKIMNRCTVSPAGCWEYPGLNARGYGELSINGRQRIAHRLTASLTKAEFSNHMQVHHACANKACCNPDHLRIVTAHENTAEMMERNFYLGRIADLEAALLALDPTHELLKKVA